MKNIVIAAGYATRLGELTKNFPKPLLKIGENTILGRMLDDIDRIPEIDEHIIITNHKFAGIFEDWKKDLHYSKPITSLMMELRRMRLVWGQSATCCLRWISWLSMMTCWWWPLTICCSSRSRSLWISLVSKEHRVSCAMSSPQ